jgi:uncharacterized protein YecE (DUF72 family)
MIRVGVGGWTYEPWRGSFYPAGLPHARELEYASRKLTSIEINGTFYRTQTPASFAKWRDATPDDFVFSVKAHRYTTNQKVLAQAGDSIQRFLGSGIAELGRKLGPILWQFSEYKRFEPEDFEAFLGLLPKSVGALPLRHALDVRHKSFACAEFVALARRYGAAIVFSDTDDYPSFANVSGDFVYARLMRCEASEPTGYARSALKAWTRRLRAWESGAEPDDLPRVDTAAAPVKPRDVFVYFINGAKERAPAAACALLSML